MGELLSSGAAGGIAGAVLFHPYRSIVSTQSGMKLPLLGVRPNGRPWLETFAYWTGIDMFCNERRVGQVRGFDKRVLLVHGNKDTTVPYSHGKCLAASLDSSKQLFKFTTLEEGGHGEVFRTHAQEIKAGLTTFLNSLG